MSQIFDTKKKFHSEQMEVLIEELTYSDSAFGSNEEGDGVFFNKRIVDAMDIEVGDEVTAHCIPNYSDKRDDIPWRCIRITRKVPAGFIHAMDREARKDARDARDEKD